MSRGRGALRDPHPDLGENESAALVDLLLQSGCDAPVVLHDDHPYGQAIAEGIQRAANAAQLTLAGSLTWDNRVASFAPLMNEVAKLRPDARVFCGLGTHVASHSVARQSVRTIFTIRCVQAS